jgi:methionine-rich copper-binding protein CopC
MKNILPIVLAAALLLAGVSRVAAHAFLDHAAPPVGATVRESPAAVKLWFTEKLEPAFSGAQVLDASGKRVDLGVKAGAVPGNAAVLEVALPKLKPGTYKVVWKAVSVDTHRTNGQFTFTLAP